MTWFSKLMISVLVWLCMVVGTLMLFSLSSRPGWGKDIDDSYQLVASPPLHAHKEVITSGVYGPFSPYYFPSLSTGDEICHLVRDDFVVICFPIGTKVGQLLAETGKTETIHAQLVAVNNGLSNRPMPEIIVNFPLADMDQNFFAKDIIKRLFRVNSIFDEPCQLTYQVDGQLQKNEEWLCSSFLKYFDIHTGQPILYYELRVRPTALRSLSDKSTTIDTTQDWFDFFNNLQNNKVLNSKVDLLNDELAVAFTLDLTDYGRWIGRLVDVYYTDTPTIDTSAYDEMVSRISDLYATGDSSEPQDVTDKTEASEKVYGPFAPGICRVNRYVGYTNNTNKQNLYQDMFLVDCNHLRSHEKKMPGWSIQMPTSKGTEDSTARPDIEENAIDLSFNLQGLEAPSAILINDTYTFLQVYTILNYSLTTMPQDFFYSRVLQDTLRSPGQLETPCTVSYIADGQQVSKESLKCDLSYKVAHDGVNIEISVDYGFKTCMRRVDKSCRKDTLMQAVSFLKEINQNTKEIVMEVGFGGGETITAELDLSDFDLAAINHLFKRIDSLD